MYLGLWLERVTGRKLRIWMGECHVHAGIRPADIERLRRSLGLDRPLYAQYFVWAAGVLTGDFGTSHRSQQPVIDELKNTIPVRIFSANPASPKGIKRCSAIAGMALASPRMRKSNSPTLPIKSDRPTKCSDSAIGQIQK